MVDNPPLLKRASPRANGEVIATIDADLQNDPEEIPRLVPMLDEHKVDMITGWRKDRQDTNFRAGKSRQANRIRNWVTMETVNDSASSLKVYRAHAVKGPETFPWSPPLLSPRS